MRLHDDRSDGFVPLLPRHELTLRPPEPRSIIWGIRLPDSRGAFVHRNGLGRASSRIPIRAPLKAEFNVRALANDEAGPLSPEPVS